MPEVIKAPQPINWSRLPSGFSTVFLAGSIEMGAAEDWQTRAAKRLPESTIILNPRRDDWDSSWVQSIDDPQFRAQVEWELDGLANVDFVLMHFEPETKSPITLLELGLVAPDAKLIVSCPDGFWRKGNVEIVCARYGVPLHDNIDAAIQELRDYL